MNPGTPLTRPVALVLLTCALIFGSVSSASATLLAPTPTPLTGSNFQGGDGNQLDEAGYDDWQSLSQIAPGDNAFVTSEADSTTHDSCFGSPNQKQLNPDGWVYIDCGTGVSPGKDNLLAGWSSVDNAGDTFLYLAFRREVQTGNTYLAFELNQRADLYHNSAGFDVPCRTDGDLLISYQVESGGSPPNVEIVVHEWKTTVADATTGCAKTGTVTELDPQPYAEGAVNAADIANYLTPGPATFAEGTFGEAALNLSGFFRSQVGANPCFDFGSVSMESHASTSFTSDLKDFIGPSPVVVANCKIDVDKQVRVRDDGVSDPTTDTYHDSVTGIVGSTLDYRFDVSVPDGSPSLQLSSLTDVLGTDPGDPAYCAPEAYLGDNDPHNYGDANDNDLIDAGEHWLFTCSYTTSESDLASSPLHNTAFAVGRLPGCIGSDSGCGASDDDDASARIKAAPSISTQASDTADLGEPISDSAHLAGAFNPTGDVTFIVYGPGDADCSGTGTNIGTGAVDSNGDAESPDYVPTAPGVYRFVAHYPGDANNEPADGACNDENESVEVQQSLLAIEKTGPDHAYDGDTITFTIKVTNPGSGPVEDVQLSDQFQGTSHGCDSLSDATGDSNGDGKLDPSETWSYTCTYAVQHGDEDSTHHVVNVATVSGKSPSGNPVGPVSDDAPVLIVHPAIAIDKTGPADAVAGEAVAYTLTVTNPGDESFAEATVHVTDARCDAVPVTLIGKGGDASPDSLDPGDVWTYTCSVQSDPGETAIHNVATVDGTDQFGKTVSATDDADTTLGAQVVLGERITPGAARLVGPSGCAAKAFNARIRGSKVATVVFVLDGKVVKRVKNNKAKVISIRINPSKLRIGVHRLVVNVTFQSGSGTKPKTLRLSFQRCGKKLAAPRFTG